MRVAVCGPIEIRELAPWLDSPSDAPDLPLGMPGTAVTQMVTGLLERGHSIVVVTLDPSIRKPIRREGDSLSLRVGPYRPRHRARDAFKLERTFVERALLDERPDVVHAHWTYEYALGALATQIPCLATVRDWAPTILRFDPTPYRGVRLLMATAVFARARHLTVTSPYMQQQVKRWTRRAATLIPNGLDDRYFCPRELPPNLASPQLLAANNGAGERKNIETLLEANARLRADYPTSCLLLVGTSYEHAGPVHEWAARRGLDDRVEFLGPIPHPELVSRLRTVDAFVHPAREESFGNVLVEAMAQGVPVIAGRSSGAVPWVLNDGEAGVLTDVDSPEQLAMDVGGLLGDEKRWWQFSKAGYARASTSFRLSTTIDLYVDEYRRLVRARTSG